MDLGVVDWLILAVVLVSTLVSLLRGFVREVISLLTWVAAFVIALGFSPLAAQWLPAAIEIPSMRVATAFLALFILVLLIGGLINWAVSKAVEKTGLSGTDRSIGLVFGAARGVFIVAVLILLAGLTAMPSEPWWQDSLLIPHVRVVAVWIHALLPADMAEHFIF